MPAAPSPLVLMLAPALVVTETVPPAAPREIELNTLLVVTACRLSAAMMPPPPPPTLCATTPRRSRRRSGSEPPVSIDSAHRATRAAAAAAHRRTRLASARSAPLNRLSAPPGGRIGTCAKHAGEATAAADALGQDAIRRFTLGADRAAVADRHRAACAGAGVAAADRNLHRAVGRRGRSGRAADAAAAADALCQNCE